MSKNMEQSSPTKALIIGGGLSGLYAAHLLQALGESFLVLEARSDFGGRIRTAVHAEQPFDLGPSWIWPNTQPRIARLLAGQLAHYAQHTVGEVILESADGLFTRQHHHDVDPRTTILQDWSTDSFTATAMDGPLSEHPAYRLPAPCHHLWNNRLRFAGTEAAPDHGGYLEGALEAAERAVVD